MQKSASRSSAPAALDGAFLKRTVVATLIAALVVALGLAVYHSPQAAGRYLIFAWWSVGFFTLTGLILRQMVIARNRKAALGFIVLKLLSLAAIFGVMIFWPIGEATRRAEGLAMFLGIATPFFVLILRVLGRMSHTRTSVAPPKGDPSSTSSGPGISAGRNSSQA